MPNRITYDASTIEELIDLFGGTSKLADMLGLGDSAICNWVARGFIPPSWHMRLYVELVGMGKKAHPELFEMPSEVGSVLYRRQGNSSVVAAE